MKNIENLNDRKIENCGKFKKIEKCGDVKCRILLNNFVFLAIIEIGTVSNKNLVFVANPNFDINVWSFDGELQGHFCSNNQSPVTSLSIENNLLVSGFMNGL